MFTLHPAESNSEKLVNLALEGAEIDHYKNPFFFGLKPDAHLIYHEHLLVAEKLHQT